MTNERRHPVLHIRAELSSHLAGVASRRPVSKVLLRSSLVFAALSASHVAGIFLAPSALAPLFAGSIYLPLTALKMLGLPVYRNAEAWGWAAPSALGWLLMLLLWGAVWWGVARLAVRWQQRTAKKADGRG